VISIRLDLAFTVLMLSTFNSNLNELHLSLVKQVLRYVKAIDRMKLFYLFKLAPPTLIMYADTSWVNDLDIVKLFSGYILKLASSVIS
jgi:hypothetical protein